jgi:hypothetical protein
VSTAYVLQCQHYLDLPSLGNNGCLRNWISMKPAHCEVSRAYVL